LAAARHRPDFGAISESLALGPPAQQWGNRTFGSPGALLRQGGACGQEAAMTYGTRTDHYPATSKILHWLVAASVLTTAPVAITMTRIAEGPTRDGLYNFHKSLGVVILVLMILRLVNRLAVGAPVADPGIAQWQKVASATVHTLFYVLLLAMPIVGYIANSAFGASTPFFGLFELPAAIDKNEALATQLFTLHRWVGWFLILLVLTHVSAALYHYFHGDNVLQRMLPHAAGEPDAVERGIRSAPPAGAWPQSR
jgi:cytochrome b561